MSLKDLKVECFDSELEVELQKLYRGNRRDFVKIGERKWFMPKRYVENGEKLYNFKTRPDDTWVVTFPRSGTTLTQELIWLVANDLNFEIAHRRRLIQRCPFIDLSLLVNKDDHIVAEDEQMISAHSVEYVQNQPSPRFIKSHMPLELLPAVVNSESKIIYVARNPKDVAISCYHFHKNNDGLLYAGTFEQFCDIFMAAHTIYSPFWEHVKGGWAKRHRPNTLFLFYEDLKRDLSGVIKKVATFYGKTYNDEQIAKLVEHLNIDNFRKNPMVNQSSPNSNMKPEDFIRQGKSGDWKKVLTSEMDEKFNKWTAENFKDRSDFSQLELLSQIFSQ